MAFIHGASTIITVATKDLSAYTNTSQLDREADVHDITMYGATSYANQGGLKKFTFTMGGTYDSTAVNSPRAVLVGSVGSTLAIVRKPEGTGTGKPNEAFSAVLAKYGESNPVADMVTWSAEFTGTGDITTTTQS